MNTHGIPRAAIGPALVTGATGKVGAAIVRALVAAGVKVKALVRDPAQATLPPDTEPVLGDLGDGSGLDKALEGVSTVFHAAGLPEQWLASPGKFFEVNVVGTRLLAEAAKRAGVRRFVHTSTIDVFDASAGETFAEDQLALTARASTYQRSKQEAERALLEVASMIEIVVINSAAVLGLPARSQSLERSLIEPALRGRLPALPPGGLNLVSADSLAQAQLCSAQVNRPSERYIVSDGYLSIRELVEMSLAVVGKHRIPPSLPRPAARAIAMVTGSLADLRGRPPMISKDQLANLCWGGRASSAKAERELGWRPAPLQESVAALVAGLAPPAPERR